MNRTDITERHGGRQSITRAGCQPRRRLITLTEINTSIPAVWSQTRGGHPTGPPPLRNGIHPGVPNGF